MLSQNTVIGLINTLAETKITVNAAAYGAVGNGVTDDQPSIQAAITAVYNAGGGVVQLDAGTFAVSRNIQMRTGVTLRGINRNKTYILSISTTNSGAIQVVSSSSTGQNDITIEDLTIDGNFRNRPTATASLLVISAATGQCQRINVSRVGITDSPFAAMQFFNCTDLTVQNCFVDGCQRDGITIWDNSTRIKIINNTVLNTGDDCIAFNSNRNSERRYRISNIVCSGNILAQASTSVLGTGIRCSGVLQGTICDNVITFAYGTGTTLDAGTYSGGDGSSPLAFSIATTQQGDGIVPEIQTIAVSGPWDVGPDYYAACAWQLEFQGQFSTGLYGASVDGVVGKVSPICTGQQLQDALVAMSNIGSGTTVSGPVQTGSAGNYVNTYTITYPVSLGNIPLIIARPLATCLLISCNNNNISNVGNASNSNSGISVRAVASYCEVIGNKIYNYYQHGISLSAPALVSNNTIGAGQNNNNSYGINIFSSAAGSIISSNRIIRCPWIGIYLSSDKCIISNNFIENAGQYNSSCTYIRVVTGATYNDITGNILSRTISGLYGIRIEASTSTCGNIISSNNGVGFASGNFQADVSTLTAAGLLPGNIIDGRLQTTLTANGNVNIPAGYLIGDITLNNTTANAVTGGIKLGTTSGGTEVLASVAVSANAKVIVRSSSFSAVPYSPSAVTILYIGAVSSWNSASVIVTVQVNRMDQN
jgi:hypothetical protein